MPAYAEMLVSQSPSAFSHPLSSDYKTGPGSPLGNGDGVGSPGLDNSVVGPTFFGGSPAMQSYCRPASLQLPQNPAVNGPAPFRRQLTPPCLSPTGGKIASSPLRSCLVVRPEDSTAETSCTQPEHISSAVPISSTAKTTDTQHFQSETSETAHASVAAAAAAAAAVAARNKKKVVFADDQGGQLTQVRVMREPSYMPPIWSLQFLAHVTQGMISPVPQEQWVVDFVQPASDYVRFRQKLDERNVSLENVIIKETEQLIVGTVKVKNLSYHKEVILRSSCDNWKTHEDTFCTYSVVGNGAASAYLIFDTFSFKLTLPPKSRRIEFCACFKCDGIEYWDNNDGRNYSLTNRVAPRQDSGDFLPSSGASAFNNHGRNAARTNGNSGFSSPYVDPTAELDTWTDMTVETQSGPYCSTYDCSTQHEESTCGEPCATSYLQMRPIDIDVSCRTASHRMGMGGRRGSTGEEFTLSLKPQPPTDGRRVNDLHGPTPLGRSASSGKLFFIRERNEGEDLLANLLRLRKLMQTQCQ
ncbi:glycogen-binding subunit 76A-like isoform X2 [Anopheles albimanus]|uniref:glycogen-binding subunit 76A-like isoform X2 n=1 Tax=Anopheles albimanus TaxID=7167 RepID=UPI00163F87FC|nr:glycogen-binding subunit 76A-like isoform X2 [Anopheles albimanus]